MTRPAHHLRPDWALGQCELALRLLPQGARMTVMLDDRRLVETGTGPALVEGQSGVSARALRVDGERAGTLLVGVPPPADGNAAEHVAALTAHALEAMIESEHGRRSIAREALDSYREMAMTQRAIASLNRSLKPAAVASALLKELESRSADAGAVFLRDEERLEHAVAASFGSNASEGFALLAASPLFAEIDRRDTGDIVNDLPESPWATDGLPYQSLLWLPLVAHEERLGVLILASTRREGFSAADMKRAQTLAGVAATALRNAQLFAAEQRMFQSFVRVIATAIDAKSPYTAGHCRRVPEITMMIAEAAHRAQDGPFADFRLDDDMRNCIEIAAMLHDCGKMVTPEWIVDKAAKLERIVDRIHLVALRFELLRRDAAIERERGLGAGESRDRVDAEFRRRLEELDANLDFLRRCNRGGEFLSDEDVTRIQAIAEERWRNAAGESLPLLDTDEVANLSIRRGTLNPEERKIIEAHATHTINMLSQIAFPRALGNVTEYAAGHHERIDGRGYPRGLTGEKLSIPARIMAIADIFEALTAPDRPYRKPGKLNWAIDTMHKMCVDGHIDRDLFELFLAEGIHRAYARRQLAAEQIEEVDVARYLGRKEALS